MQRQISVKREHPADPMIPDVSTATGTNSMSATNLEYFRLFKSCAALDAEPGLKMVENRSLVENESVQVASQANALPPLNISNINMQEGFMKSRRRRHYINFKTKIKFAKN